MTATEADDLFIGDPGRDRNYYEVGQLIDEGGQGQLFVGQRKGSRLCGPDAIEKIVKRCGHADTSIQPPQG